MIWVIGCKGMLGTELCRQLSENHIDYVSSDCDVDITDYSALKAFAAEKSLSFIINCAAYTAVDKAESEAEFAEKLNALGPANIARVAKECGAKLIHISTDYVFDGTGSVPYTEDMPVAPIGVYGATKAAGEKAVVASTEAFYILRTAWLYGWAGKNFVYTMIRAMNMRDSVKVVADQSGSPTFCGDLVGVIIKIIERAESGNPVSFGIYHVTDEGETTWFHFTQEIKKQAMELGLVTNAGCVVNSCTTAEYPTPAKRPAYSVLSKVKIQKALDFKLPLWQESLSKFLNGSDFDKSRIQP